MTTDPLDAFIENPAAATKGWVQPEIGRLEQKIETLQVENARERVHRTLDADPMLAGKWRSLNEDPAFLRWLDEIDGLSGERKLAMLHRAYNAGDATRVGHFFRAFVAQRIPASARTEHRLPFEGGRPQPNITEAHLTRGRMWRRDEITAFYNDVRLGRYADREAQRLRIEAEIVKAASEGRVVNPPVRTSNDAI